MIEGASKKSRSPYRKYPSAVRAEIARTGNVYLFPNMKIPRTTAQYWAKKTESVLEPEPCDSLYRQQNDFLRQELEKARIP